MTKEYQIGDHVKFYVATHLPNVILRGVIKARAEHKDNLYIIFDGARNLSINADKIIGYAKISEREWNTLRFSSALLMSWRKSTQCY